MALERLGKAYLYEGKAEDGLKNFEEAVKTDPAKSILFLDLARYHIMSVRRDNNLKDSALPAAEKAIKRYLDSDPCVPLKAYTLGLSAKIKWALGDKAAGDKLLQEAKAIDPFFSKASGIPSLHLFVPLGKISYNHAYFSRPF